MTEKLSERLAEGCIYRDRRWSGDTHEDEGGCIDEAATDDLMAEAAAIVKAWEDAPEAFVMFGKYGFPTHDGRVYVNSVPDGCSGKRVKIVEVE